MYSIVLSDESKEQGEGTFPQSVQEWLVPSNMNYFGHECYCYKLPYCTIVYI